MAGEFLDLMLRDDKQMQRKVALRIYEVIAESFAQDRSRVTQDETKRRFRIVEQLFRELRTDCGWAYTRILDALPVALRCRLDGAPWDPTQQRAIWTPGSINL